ncbi:terpene synthase family protein [Planomonospora venezuelensis]|uniref:Terpene synthase n=1 Tax=Planomonospora venezuelensis TaxID=1999 RepID=A0A841DCK6_PLAVE|nr:terpene synthase family protein [Planomonospora venezuelensis]MBB5967219.1 hypothetical protein [Planomonospora venezuelensis]GIN02990.1 hypothetical protein Pve01_46480 [Planomonospora venezuelensis]
MPYEVGASAPLSPADLARITDDLRPPPLFCPIDSAINPAARRVERRAIAWIDEAGFCADPRERAWVIATRSADFYARFAPHAGEDPLLSAVLWVYWGFAFDDARCDAGHFSSHLAAFVPMAARVQRALERPCPSEADDAYAQALHDVAARFRRTAAPVQFQRFVSAHRAWLAGVSWQIANQEAGVMPGLEDYLTMRLHSAGGEPTFAMLEIANGLEVPAAEMDSPVLRALTEMAIATAALDNDRHSLAKELSRRQADQNIYTVLLSRHTGSLAEAVHAAACLRDRILCRFLRLREATLPRLSSAARCYVDGLAHGIRGNAEWGLRVPRYLSRGSVPGEAGETPITWAERPLDDTPLSLPAVAWWWDRAL